MSVCSLLFGPEDVPSFNRLASLPDQMGQGWTTNVVMKKALTWTAIDVIVPSPWFSVSKSEFNHAKQMRLPTVVVRGDVLASWLTVSDLTRSRLAEELGVSRGRISQLLTSQDEPSAHLIAKLIDITHLPFDRLFKIVHNGHVEPNYSKSRGRRVAVTS